MKAIYKFQFTICYLSYKYSLYKKKLSSKKHDELLKHEILQTERVRISKDYNVQFRESLN